MEAWERVTRAYLDAWNRRDANGIVEVFENDGTYQDSATGDERLNGAAIAAMAQGLFDAFPDLHFEEVYQAPAGDGRVVLQWIMHGTNTGSMRGLPPTGRVISLPGIDMIEIRDDKIQTLRGYFDSSDLFRQMGLEVLIQPADMGAFSFGTALHLHAKPTTQPGALSLTWIDFRDEDKVEDFLEMGQQVPAI